MLWFFINTLQPGTHMAVSVVISFCGAKSRAFRDDRPRTRSEDRPGHPRRRKPGHAGLADAPSVSLRAAQRKSRGGENLPLRKALKTHETGKSTGSDRQRGASPRENLRWLQASAKVRPASRRVPQGNSRGGENFPPRKALKTHESGKSTGGDRQRRAM
jgi:hypothetical protein